MLIHFLDSIDFSSALRLVAGRCLTETGQAKVLSLVPMEDEEACQALLSEIRQMEAFLRTERVLPLPEPTVFELACQITIAAGTFLSPQECRELADQLLLLDRTRQALSHSDPDQHPCLRDYYHQIPILSDLLQSALRLVDDKGEIRADASSELRSVRNEIVGTQGSIQQTLKEICRRPEMRRFLQDDFITSESGRYAIPLKEGFESRCPGVVHRVSGSGATLFMEPLEVLPMGNRLEALKDKEARIIRELLLAFAQKVRENREGLLEASRVASELDVLQAKGRMVVDLGWSVPAVGSGRPFQLHAAWHPLLKAEGSRQVIPLFLGLPEGIRVLLITGPNAGGKTVALKTIGLVVSLAQSGLPVPTRENTELPFFTRLFEDIGDEQDIATGESTFASHLRRIVQILKESQGQSLVLMDELCSGTDPLAATAMGQAILEALVQQDCTVFCTTHLHALSLFVQKREDMVNAAMSFDSYRGEPTYRLALGEPGTSHAFEAAERWGMPAPVLARATELIGEERVVMEKLLSELKDEKEAVHKEREELSRLVRQAQKEKDCLSSERKDLRLSRQQILAEANSEARHHLSDVKKEADRLVDALRRRTGNPLDGKEVTSKLELMKKHASPAREKPERPAPGPALETGMEVTLAPTGRRGKIVEKRKDGMALVATDGLNLLVSQSDLSPAAPATRKQGSVFHDSSDSPLFLDLRGMRVHEAERALTVFLDRLILSDMREVEIIHGEGTGALKAMTIAMLKTHPAVAGYLLNPSGRGGATVVQVKGD